MGVFDYVVDAGRVSTGLSCRSTTPVTCDCHSSNGGHGKTPAVVLDPRPLFPCATRTVSVDACIADVIEALWLGGIWTRGCCCGHGRESPSVALDDLLDAPRVLPVLVADGREWKVFSCVGNSPRPCRLHETGPGAASLSVECNDDVRVS